MALRYLKLGCFIQFQSWDAESRLPAYFLVGLLGDRCGRVGGVEQPVGSAVRQRADWIEILPSRHFDPSVVALASTIMIRLRARC